MSKLTELYDGLESAFTNLKDEIADFDNGKKVAAGRVRKLSQEGKKILQDIRVATMEQLKSMPTKKREE